MNKDFEKCLKNRKIVKQNYVSHLIDDELKAAKDDLARARKTYEESSYKWATIQAYYVMFHAAKALLYSKGYREKSHHCLKVAISALFVDEGLLEKRYVDDFDTSMLLREAADYKHDFSEESSKVALENAKRFLAKATEILAKY